MLHCQLSEIVQNCCLSCTDVESLKTVELLGSFWGFSVYLAGWSYFSLIDLDGNTLLEQLTTLIE